MARVTTPPRTRPPARPRARQKPEVVVSRPAPPQPSQPQPQPKPQPETQPQPQLPEPAPSPSSSPAQSPQKPKTLVKAEPNDNNNANKVTILIPPPKPPPVFRDPSKPWNHPDELEFITPGWNEELIIMYLCDHAFSIPPKPQQADPWCFVTLDTDASTVVIPRSYRTPLLFVMKFLWESLRLVLTSPSRDQEWEDYKFDILYVSRLCADFLDKAKEVMNKSGMDRSWRCATFDRAITRYYRRWLVSREQFLKDFWLEFDEEVYQEDILKKDWKRFVLKGHKGFHLTKEETENGLSCKEYADSITTLVDGRVAWVPLGTPLPRSYSKDYSKDKGAGTKAGQTETDKGKETEAENGNKAGEPGAKAAGGTKKKEKARGLEDVMTDPEGAKKSSKRRRLDIGGGIGRVVKKGNNSPKTRILAKKRSDWPPYPYGPPQIRNMPSPAIILPHLLPASGSGGSTLGGTHGTRRGLSSQTKPPAQEPQEKSGEAVTRGTEDAKTGTTTTTTTNAQGGNSDVTMFDLAMPMPVPVASGESATQGHQQDQGSSNDASSGSTTKDDHTSNASGSATQLQQQQQPQPQPQGEPSGAKEHPASEPTPGAPDVPQSAPPNESDGASAPVVTGAVSTNTTPEASRVDDDVGSKGETSKTTDANTTGASAASTTDDANMGSEGPKEPTSATAETASTLPLVPTLPQAATLPQAPIPPQAPVLPQLPTPPQAPTLPQVPTLPQAPTEAGDITQGENAENISTDASVPDVTGGKESTQTPAVRQGSDTLQSATLPPSNPYLHLLSAPITNPHISSTTPDNHVTMTTDVNAVSATPPTSATAPKQSISHSDNHCQAPILSSPLSSPPPISSTSSIRQFSPPVPPPMSSQIPERDPAIDASPESQPGLVYPSEPSDAPVPDILSREHSPDSRRFVTTSQDLRYVSTPREDSHMMQGVRDPFQETASQHYRHSLPSHYPHQSSSAMPVYRRHDPYPSPHMSYHSDTTHQPHYRHAFNPTATQFYTPMGAEIENNRWDDLDEVMNDIEEPAAADPMLSKVVNMVRTTLVGLTDILDISSKQSSAADRARRVKRQSSSMPIASGSQSRFVSDFSPSANAEREMASTPMESRSYDVFPDKTEHGSNPTEDVGRLQAEIRTLLRESQEQEAKHRRESTRMRLELDDLRRQVMWLGHQQQKHQEDPRMSSIDANTAPMRPMESISSSLQPGSISRLSKSLTSSRNYVSPTSSSFLNAVSRSRSGLAPSPLTGRSGGTESHVPARPLPRDVHRRHNLELQNNSPSTDSSTPSTTRHERDDNPLPIKAQRKHHALTPMSPPRSPPQKS